MTGVKKGVVHTVTLEEMDDTLAIMGAKISGLEYDIQRAQEQINKIWKALADDYGKENAEWIELERRVEEVEGEVEVIRQMRQFEKIQILEFMHATKVRLTAIEAKLDVGE